MGEEEGLEEKLRAEGWIGYPVLPIGDEEAEEWSQKQEQYFMTAYDSSSRVRINLFRHLLGQDNMKIIDLGMNGGDLVSRLVEMGHDAYGLDLPLLAERAKQEYPELATRFFSCNLEFEDIPGSDYDLVLAIGLIEHLKNYEGLLEKISRVLKVGGKVYLLTCNTDAEVSVEPLHCHHFTPMELASLTVFAGLWLVGFTSTSKTNLIGTFRKVVV